MVDVRSHVWFELYGFCQLVQWCCHDAPDRDFVFRKYKVIDVLQIPYLSREYKVK